MKGADTLRILARPSAFLQEIAWADDLSRRIPGPACIEIRFRKPKEAATP